MRPLVLLVPLLVNALALPCARAQDDDPPPLGISTGAPRAPAEDPPRGVATDPRADPPTEEAETPAAASAGDESSVEVRRRREDVEEDEMGEGTPDAEEEDDEVEAAPAARGWSDERVAAWATLGSSFGVAVLGGILLAAGLDAVNTVENAPDGTRWEDVAGARDRAPVLSGLGLGVLALGLAGSAVGAGLLAHFGEGGTWLAVSAGPSGVHVRGRY